MTTYTDYLTDKLYDNSSISSIIGPNGEFFSLELSDGIKVGIAFIPFCGEIIFRGDQIQIKDKDVSVERFDLDPKTREVAIIEGNSYYKPEKVNKNLSAILYADRLERQLNGIIPNLLL